MKQNLRLRGFYCPKQIKPIHELNPEYAAKKQDAHIGTLRTCFAFLRTFFSLSPAIYYEFIKAYLSRTYQNLSQNSDTGYSWLRRWQNKGRRKSGVSMLGLAKPRPMPCSSPPSVTLPSGPIPICPAYTSVKSPKSGTLAKGKRLHSGRKAYTDRSGIADGLDRDATGVCFGSASELNANSEPPRFVLDLFQPNQGTTKSRPRPNQGTTKLRSHLQEYPQRGWSVARPSTIWDWFEDGNTLVRQLFGLASAFSRSIVEGFSKPSRTIVEALSKDCRTSLEQQSNTCRRNFEESCVWTHAKAPAHSGLGLALGMMVGLLCCGIAKAQFHQPSEVTVRIGETLPESFFETVHQAVNMQTGEKATIRLADHRDKLIILDFWASWCGPCIHSLNKLDSLNRHDGDGQYVVIPVTYQSADEASRAYEKYGWHFNGIVGDTMLGKIFPHSGLPHMVWVKDGKVAAMPQTQFVTAESIGEMLDNRIPDIPMAKLIYNPTNPLSTNNESYGGKLLYTAELAAGDPRFQQQRLGLVHQDGMLILSGVNLPLVESLLFGAYRSSIAPGLTPNNGIVFETGDKVDSLLRMPRPLITQYDDPDDYRSAYETWVRTFRYSYRVAIPDEMGADAAYTAMRQDIVSFIYQRFGLRVTIENRPDPVLFISQHETAN